MPSNSPKHRRLVYVATAIIAVAVGAIVVSNRATDRAPSTPTTARAVQPPQISASGGAAQSAPSTTRRGPASTYFVDPATGLPREPTAEELLALQQQLDPQQQTPRSSEGAQPFTTDTGFTGLRLSDDQMIYAVATRNANGSVTLSHAQGRKAADRLVNDAAQGGIRAGKEQRLER